MEGNPRRSKRKTVVAQTEKSYKRIKTASSKGSSTKPKKIHRQKIARQHDDKLHHHEGQQQPATELAQGGYQAMHEVDEFA